VKKILLVEDSAPNRKLYGHLIGSLGHIPFFASDGKRGLFVFEDNPDIACIVTDCQMPEMSGPDMVRELRKRYGNDLPILVYSSFLSVKDVGELLDQGATAFLPYPLTRDTLKEYLQRYL
jgi:CheY-like chemotaxis protein